jgi:pyruvate dehydrogenase E1 component alpha subunit
VLFVCENNLYGMGTSIEKALAVTDIAARAASYGMPAEAVDGMQVLAVEEAVTRAADAVRAGEGPHFVELKTYRFRAHSMADPDLYRTREEIEGWRTRDPIDLFVALLREQGRLDDAGLAELEATVAAEIDEAVAFADAGPVEPLEDLLEDVYTR